MGLNGFTGLEKPRTTVRHSSSYRCDKLMNEHTCTVLTLERGA